ncbi:MAG TPA: NAD(P)H-dependent glycerol-3-phosphate dehydrogenase [Tenericutes bacterium]|jgi:glycerol-3-phosphate dehydrogenase (NAD(P)+)|nr:NAD(P)H-dependent glycerol-3-phosphate dehydrogenase [Mycoplasmatota bacterium]
MEHIAILGAGSWGTALAQVLADNNARVTLWTISEEQKEEINKHHTNKEYVGDVILPDTIFPTTSLEDAIKDTKIIVIAVPTKAIREVLGKLKEVLKDKYIFVNVAKGIEPDTNKLVSEIIEDEIPKEHIEGIVILSGPSHAEEVILRQITTIVSASESETLAKQIQYLFNNDYLRVYTSTDIRGVQMCGALKNVIALASGIIAGKGYGDNTRAALITRGMAEIIRYGTHHGALKETFGGLAGIGDLIVTATSTHSRNFMAGYRVGQGEDPKESVNKSKMVVEGIRTAKAVYEELKNLNFEMPITTAVYKVFYENYDVDEAIKELMNRELKSEIE